MNTKDSIWWKVIHFGLEFVGRHYGKYRAFVIDNQDELNMGRCRLRIPHLNPSQDDYIWAFPAGQWGGKNYGVQMLPQKGDMVFVEFDHGDPEYPMWSPGGWAQEEKPEEFASTNHYGFKTPAGTLVVINDIEDEEEILIRLNSQLDWIKITTDELETESKLIKLGKNGQEWAAMGETLLDKMEKMSEKLDETYDTLILHTHPTNVGPSGPPIQSVDLTTQKTDMIALKETFVEWLSGKVKIDKD